MAKQEERTQIAVPANDCPVILHLSDLHFGREHTENEKKQRTLVLKLLIDEIRQRGEEWMPTSICITGDITHTGAAPEYSMAYKWLAQVLRDLSLDGSMLFFCPGNHDVDWKVAKQYPMPSSEEECDALLEFPLPQWLTAPFDNYRKFLKRLRTPDYHYAVSPTKRSSFFGLREARHRVDFVCCNSCFFSWEDGADGKLMLGNNLLDYMQSGDLLKPKPTHTRIQVVLMHHSPEHLRDSERHTWDTKPAAFSRLADMSHLILMGHEHAKPEPWVHTGWHAYSSCIGAAFFGIQHPNAFQLIRVNWLDRQYECKPYQWDSSHRKWEPSQGFTTEWPFYREHTEPNRAGATSREERIDDKAESLAGEMWGRIQRHDFEGIDSLWQKERSWFAENRAKIDARTVQQIELCVAEMKERLDTHA